MTLYLICLFNNDSEASMFLDYLNKQHPNIKFTSEPEQNEISAFLLDVNIEKKGGGGFYTSIFHKLSNTGLLINFLSYIPFAHKVTLIKTLIHPVYKICNTWTRFNKKYNRS